MVEKYKFVGSGVTNSQGVAQLTHDANGNPLATPGYVGSGKGLTQIVASTDDPSHISEGSLQSETFDVWDTLVHDENVTTTKIYNYNLEDRDFYCEFIVHPSSSTDSRGVLAFSQDANNVFLVGDLYSSTNNNCGINWSGGAFYGKTIPVDEDTLVTVTRTGTDIILTVGESTYTISDMKLELNTLVRATVENNSIKNFRLYLVPQIDRISIRASANIMQTGENVTIRGRLHYNGEIVKNTDLDVYKNGVKVGTANTGSTGVASYTYTGVGAGATEFQFKYGSLVSEIYEVWDTLWFDVATENQHRTDWTSTLTPQYTTDGTIITESSGTSTNYYANFTAIDNVAIEMDLTLMEAIINNGIRFRYKGVDRYLRSFLSDLQTHHFKFVCENGSVILYVDGVEQGTAQSTTSATNMYFTLNNASIKFSNLKVYPI